MILRFSPISKHFQNPKNVIKAKDPWLALIDVAVLGFLTTGPLLVGTQDAQLPAPLTTKLLHSQEPPIPSDEETKEPSPKLVQEVTDKDFEIFYQQEDPKDAPRTLHHPLRLAKVSSSQEGVNIPKGMVDS